MPSWSARQALKHTREEVPHSIEVHVEDVMRRDDGLTVVRAVLWVESASQKTILIGRGGSMVRAIGTSARQGDRARARRRARIWT